ncbi:MAG: small metal-binding protein SmbP [Nitrospira sp.]|nr:small metal-binding protein SmbP [Nitrospira sp.]MDH4303439.1 small metal-binding protein SmbP [Nitrospira sp.]MDH5194284.1 small metal-binding protein SmbP [Nitrospira sp.]
MTRHRTRLAVALTGALLMLFTATLPLQPTFGEGGARRDNVRQEQTVKEVLKHAMEAVDHGKQGHTDKLVTSAEASLQQALRGGKDPHVADAIANLKEAIEHGKAGHADVATKHAEDAVTHLSQVK